MLHWTRDDFELSTDPARMDFEVIHGFLSQSYWATGRPEDVMRRALENSLCFGVYHRGAQVAFARVVTDKATFGYLADVFVLPEYRGRGLSKWIMEAVDAHPDLQSLRRFMLATRDAHGLYAQFRFHALEAPERFMERRGLGPR